MPETNMHLVSLLFHDVYERATSESGFCSPAADRYKLSVPEFEAQVIGAALVRPDAPRLATDLLSAAGQSGQSSGGCGFVFTADDGGVSYHTCVAERLEAFGWRGHCFVTTDAVGNRGFLDAAQLRSLDVRGHVIGTHTASHPPRLSACTFTDVRQEWTRSRQALEDILGHAVVTGSVPGGYHSRHVALAARDAGLRLLFTSNPTTCVRDVEGLLVAGRFTLRRGHPPDMAAGLVAPAPWKRYAEWARWNAKGVAKPVLGSSYGRVADWILNHG
jgi:peptidoglycan/xylan/chitin deacetylase (PgdA/CDA1 family)